MQLRCDPSRNSQCYPRKKLGPVFKDIESSESPQKYVMFCIRNWKEIAFDEPRDQIFLAKLMKQTSIRRACREVVCNYRRHSVIQHVGFQCGQWIHESRIDFNYFLQKDAYLIWEKKELTGYTMHCNFQFSCTVIFRRNFVILNLWEKFAKKNFLFPNIKESKSSKDSLSLSLSLSLSPIFLFIYTHIATIFSLVGGSRVL